MPEINLDPSPNINASVFFRRDVNVDETPPDDPIDLPTSVSSLLQLCLNYINKNGRVLFGDIKVKKEQKAEGFARPKPLKKKKKRNRDYLTRIANPKRIRYLRRQKELKELQKQLPLASNELDPAVTDAQSAKGRDGTYSEGDQDINVTDDVTDDGLADSGSESLRSRPKRKGTIPFYVPDHVSTPSPELRKEKPKIKTKPKDQLASGPPPNSTLGPKRRSEPVVLPAKLLKSRLNSDIPRPKCMRPGGSAGAPPIQWLTPKTNTNTINSSEKAPRVRQRVNYSEDLLDEALMYEEILLNAGKKMKTLGTKGEKTGNSTAQNDGALPSWLQGSGPKSKAPAATSTSTSISTSTPIKQETLPVFGNEITIVPINKSDDRKKAGNATPMSLKLDTLKKTLSTNPEKVFKFNSAVSIQLKSSQRVSPSPSPGITIQSVQSLFDDSKRNGKDWTKNCKYCLEFFETTKLLAKHQLVHLKIVTHKIGQVQIMDPKHRRVSETVYNSIIISFEFNKIVISFQGRVVKLGSESCIRCLNCWKLYPNGKSTLEHWNNGKCLFYCSICGKSFHDNIKSIRDHFPEEHGIRYRIPERPAKLTVKELMQKRAEQAAATCPICNLTFANRYAKNSHMRMHKRDPPIQSDQPSRVSSPATSASSTGSGDNRKRAWRVTTPKFRPAPTSKVNPAHRLSAAPNGQPKRKQFAAKTNPRVVRAKPTATSVRVKTEFVDTGNSFMDTGNYDNLLPGGHLDTESDAPRLQVKKLQDLQDPYTDNGMNAQLHVASGDPYYENAYEGLDMQTQPGYMDYIGQPMTVAQSLPQSHMIPSISIQQTTQFNISDVQPVQDAQFYDYNPVYGVQQPDGIVNLPVDPNGYQQSYIEPSDYHQFT